MQLLGVVWIFMVGKYIPLNPYYRYFPTTSGNGDTRTLGHWDNRTMGHWDFKTMGGVKVQVPTNRNRVVTF